jgi:hypothetical protein
VRWKSLLLLSYDLLDYSTHQKEAYPQSNFAMLSQRASFCTCSDGSQSRVSRVLVHGAILVE